MLEVRLESYDGVWVWDCENGTGDCCKPSSISASETDVDAASGDTVLNLDAGGGIRCETVGLC